MYLWIYLCWGLVVGGAEAFELQDNVLDELTSYNTKYQDSRIPDEETDGYWNLISNLLLELASTIGMVSTSTGSDLSGTGSEQYRTSVNQMEDSARMLQMDYQPGGNTGYQSHMPVQLLSGYGFEQQEADVSYGMSQNGYVQSQQDGFNSQKSGYRMKHREARKKGYHQKPEKVYVPIVIKKKKQKKMKTISVYKGFYIPGGSQVFGKFKKLKDCKKSCDVSPVCFSADYNPWLKKCYHHSNVTACGDMRTHPKLTHFKKIPCQLLETPRGVITIGTHIFGGLEQKGIKSLQDCIKKCATAGKGIAPNTAMINMQICFAIDYDFASHKCYFHTDSDLCPMLVVTPASLSPKPSSINILLCPLAT